MNYLSFVFIEWLIPTTGKSSQLQTECVSWIPVAIMIIKTAKKRKILTDFKDTYYAGATRPAGWYNGKWYHIFRPGSSREWLSGYHLHGSRLSFWSFPWFSPSGSRHRNNGHGYDLHPSSVQHCQIFPGSVSEAALPWRSHHPGVIPVSYLSGQPLLVFLHFDFPNQVLNFWCKRK